MRSKPRRMSAAPAVVALMVVVSTPAAAQEGEAPEPPTAEAERAEALRRVVEAPLLVSRPGMDEVEVRRDMAYTADGDAGPRLDVYLPERGSAGTARRPAIVFVHGGPLAPGAYPEGILRPKDWRLYRDYGRLVAAAGFVGVVPNHRYPSTAELERSIDAFVAAATEAGATVDLLLHPTGQHGFDARDDVPRTLEIVGRTLAFFDDALRGGEDDELPSRGADGSGGL